MEPDAFMLARLLSMAALLAATIEYAEILKRRDMSRMLAWERTQMEGEGLRGLVRVLLADSENLETKPDPGL
jgi:hypothetical protein